MKKHNDIITKSIQQYKKEQLKLQDDKVCVEEPLELRVPFLVQSGITEYRTLAITMRTPGNDFDLARGFLYSEGVIAKAFDILDFRYCDDRGTAGSRNSLELQLKTPVPVDSHLLESRFTTYSSCGLCGKTSIQSLELQNPPRLNEQTDVIDAGSLKQLSATMLKHQPLFQQTGSAHASGLFDTEGNLFKICEDIGRHNALDKLIGYCLQEAPERLANSILLVSGRASFELVQKAIKAGIPMMAAAGAPSSLAVETAKRFNLTLIGFLRSGGFNIYNAGWRLKTSEEDKNV
ncbi:MAG: formate dehydrogenase accessory sulfurtransferase FdhD [Gammaproteobacteria bacterium]|nr:formate dehydrogenase accessory sulfurtransferase FdhD [Gammaproteobacteria bacterium]